MGHIGFGEILIVMVLALVVFGPQRLPEIARQIGKALGEVRRVSTKFEQEVRTGLALDEPTDENFPYMRPPEQKGTEQPGTEPSQPQHEAAEIVPPGAEHQAPEVVPPGAEVPPPEERS
ncbi:MAG TPA: twin-arginine translocase TatA/TatE family subunit [Actinomycetota bacterium]|nr:twin-arginine translocase TatA/TatE family subunit [Actinomycetota bacterium]